MKIDVIEKIANVLNITVSTFFEGEKSTAAIQNNSNGGYNHIIIGAEKQEITKLKKQNEQLQKELHAAKDKIISLLEKNT